MTVYSLERRLVYAVSYQQYELEFLDCSSSSGAVLIYMLMHSAGCSTSATLSMSIRPHTQEQKLYWCMWSQVRRTTSISSGDSSYLLMATIFIYLFNFNEVLCIIHSRYMCAATSLQVSVSAHTTHFQSSVSD
jgi:hypothetical protein